jgi:hypothetical protein
MQNRQAPARGLYALALMQLERAISATKRLSTRTKNREIWLAAGEISAVRQTPMVRLEGVGCDTVIKHLREESSLGSRLLLRTDAASQSAACGFASRSETAQNGCPLD